MYGCWADEWGGFAGYARSVSRLLISIHISVGVAYALSGIAVRSAERFGSVVSAAWKVLDIDERPIRLLGIVAMLIVTLAFLAGVPLVAR